MHANTQEREFTLFNKAIKWTSQAVANLYAELVGPPYSLEGREGMRKSQFQQLMHKLKVPMPRTGPFSSTMNDRMFHMFDKRKTGRVSLEDLLHGLHVLSNDARRDKLALAFKAFDMNNKGQVTLAELMAAVRDVTNLLYVGKKVPTPERVRMFAIGVMAPYNEDEADEEAYLLNAQQFIDSAEATSGQLANLFSLGSIDPSGADAAKASEEADAAHEAEAAPPAKPKPGPGHAPPSRTGPAPTVGRGVGPAPIARGGAGRGVGRGLAPADAETASETHLSPEPVRERRRSSHERDNGAAAAVPKENRRASEGKGVPLGGIALPQASAAAAGAGTLISPRGSKPPPPAVANEKRRSDGDKPSPKDSGAAETDATETTDEMNKRLVAHVRALQAELRKYMDLDKEHKQEMEQLRTQVTELSTENVQLKKKLQKASQDAKQHAKVKDKEKEKDQTAKALAKRAGEVENEMANMEHGFASVLQFLVGPPIEQKRASTLQDVRVLKCGSMVKRGGVIKSWKRRLFILRENMQLIYYAVDERPQPRGILDIRTVVVVRVPKEAPSHVLEIITTSRHWFVACDSEEDAQEWCQLLNHMVETNKLRPAVGAERLMMS